MTDMLLSVLNMSLTASFVIVIVLLLRFPLKKAPKIISYALWSVVAFRLICPISFESILSFLPLNTAPIPQNIAYQQVPQINSGIPAVDTYVNGSLPAPMEYASINPLQIYLFLIAVLWLMGMVGLLCYSVISMILLKLQLKTAYHMQANIYRADNLKTPFVLGIVEPRIFIPAGLGEEEMGYIIRHEQTHIRRKDHIIKLIAYVILSLHWFNPLVWLAFILMCADMELSCDERVIREMGTGIKKAYSTSLLTLATGRHTWNGSPLAFGEGNIKSRIKNVLGYKKSRLGVLAVVILIVAVAAIGLLSNPVTEDQDLSFLNTNSLLSRIAEQEQIAVTTSRFGETDLKGSVLAGWLDTAENDWKKRSSPSIEPKATIIINIDDKQEHQLCFFESKTSLALVINRDEKRYYSIPEEDYSYLLELIKAKVLSEHNETTIAEPTEVSSETTLELIGATWSRDQNMGADMVSLDYASDNLVIFHGYFGLFIYDLSSLRIIRSLDLVPLGCHYTQGDNYCEVSVSRDGDTVQLHPLSSEKMYIFRISDMMLSETAYHEMEDRFNSFVSIETVLNTNELGNYSYNAVSFGAGDYGYLSTEDGTLGTLSYTRGDMVYSLYGADGD
jgi:beta-lactamase regulating signal transducer with metallopeptidase domain